MAYLLRMDGSATDPVYRLRTVGVSRTNAILLTPLLVALGWLAQDFWSGSLTIWTLAAAGLVGFIGLIGLAVVLTPIELRADIDGLSWRQLGYRKTYRWSEIDNVGVAVSKAFDGYDRPSVRLLVGRPRIAAPMIGLNLRQPAGDPGVVAYRRGLTGFDSNLRNVFPVPTSDIVAELEARLLRSRSG